MSIPSAQQQQQCLCRSTCKDIKRNTRTHEQRPCSTCAFLDGVQRLAICSLGATTAAINQTTVRYDVFTFGICHGRQLSRTSTMTNDSTRWTSRSRDSSAFTRGICGAIDVRPSSFDSTSVEPSSPAWSPHWSECRVGVFRGSSLHIFGHGA